MAGGSAAKKGLTQASIRKPNQQMGWIRVGLACLIFWLFSGFEASRNFWVPYYFHFFGALFLEDPYVDT